MRRFLHQLLPGWCVGASWALGCWTVASGLQARGVSRGAPPVWRSLAEEVSLPVVQRNCALAREPLPDVMAQQIRKAAA